MIAQPGRAGKPAPFRFQNPPVAPALLRRSHLAQPVIASAAWQSRPHPSFPPYPPSFRRKPESRKSYRPINHSSYNPQSQINIPYIPFIPFIPVKNSPTDDTRPLPTARPFSILYSTSSKRPHGQAQRPTPAKSNIGSAEVQDSVRLPRTTRSKIVGFTCNAGSRLRTTH